MEEKDTNEIKEPDFNYQGQYTYADYMGWQLDEMVEIIKGKLFKMAPAPGSTHQTVSGNLHLVFGNYFKNKTCKVFAAPFDVILPIADKQREKSTTVVQPDLCVICNPSFIEERGCFGAPDLIIEILSPSTSKKDMTDKYEVYEEAGVKEYWIVMPKEQLIEIFLLEKGKYQRKGTYVFEDNITSAALPGLVVPLSEVFEKKHEI